MTSARRPSSPRRALAGAIAGGSAGEWVELRARLAEAEATLSAIGAGEVDAVVVAGKRGEQVFTLHGADQVYRILIESMNEGALTLTADKTIIYANQCFAKMVKRPLEQVVGGSFRRFLSAADRATFRALLKHAGKSGTKLQAILTTGDGSRLPVQISIRPLSARKGSAHAVIGMVVTDMTEARRTEELLRALTHRVVQGQEAERGSVALELHDHITQLLCAVLYRSQALADKLSVRDGPAKREAGKLRDLLSETAEAVERIARGLRPGVLEHLGLVAVLRGTTHEFEERTGVRVNLTGVELAARLSADAEMALFRILQEAMKNVEKHARARHVTVDLSQPGAFVQLTIRDDGDGFDPFHLAAQRIGSRGLGLLGMRERATSLGGTLKVKSKRGTGTEVEVRLPVPRTSRRAT